MKTYKCKVINVNSTTPDSKLPERFKLNSEWYYTFSQGFYYIDGKYFTNNEFYNYFEIIL